MSGRSENNSKLAARAASGRSRSLPVDLHKPDTIVYGPDGKELRL